jgi:hypothetical protein
MERVEIVILVVQRFCDPYTPSQTQINSLILVFFDNLSAGTYQIVIQDEAGCFHTIMRLRLLNHNLWYLNCKLNITRNLW